MGNSSSYALPEEKLKKILHAFISPIGIEETTSIQNRVLLFWGLSRTTNQIYDYTDAMRPDIFRWIQTNFLKDNVNVKVTRPKITISLKKYNSEAEALNFFKQKDVHAKTALLRAESLLDLTFVSKKLNKVKSNKNIGTFSVVCPAFLDASGLTGHAICIVFKMQKTYLGYFVHVYFLDSQNDGYTGVGTEFLKRILEEQKTKFDMPLIFEDMEDLCPAVQGDVGDCAMWAQFLPVLVVGADWVRTRDDVLEIMYEIHQRDMLPIIMFQLLIFYFLFKARATHVLNIVQKKEEENSDFLRHTSEYYADVLNRHFNYARCDQYNDNESECTRTGVCRFCKEAKSGNCISETYFDLSACAKTRKEDAMEYIGRQLQCIGFEDILGNYFQTFFENVFNVILKRKRERVLRSLKSTLPHVKQAKQAVIDELNARD